MPHPGKCQLESFLHQPEYYHSRPTMNSQNLISSPSPTIPTYKDHTYLNAGSFLTARAFFVGFSQALPTHCNTTLEVPIKSSYLPAFLLQIDRFPWHPLVLFSAKPFAFQSIISSTSPLSFIIQ